MQAKNMGTVPIPLYWVRTVARNKKAARGFGPERPLHRHVLSASFAAGHSIIPGIAPASREKVAHEQALARGRVRREGRGDGHAGWFALHFTYYNFARVHRTTKTTLPLLLAWPITFGRSARSSACWNQSLPIGSALLKPLRAPRSGLGTWCPWGNWRGRQCATRSWPASRLWAYSEDRARFS